MSNIFLYPKVTKIVGSPNPYITNFTNALSRYHTVVNANAKNRGILNFYENLLKTDIFILNWIESLPEKRFGKLQAIFFVLFTFCAKILKKKIVWILHNKYSHHKRRNRWIDFMYRFMMTHSDIIITHSTGGISFVDENYPQASSKVKMLIHPIHDVFPRNPLLEKQYDILIWGSIFPYKGILEFLKYINTNPFLNSLKIIIVGRCSNEQYKSELLKTMGKNVTFYDKFFTMEDIARFANLSRFTLFTYKSTSVISSGSLMDSIRMGSNVIGPNHGAFKDLKQYGFIETYDNLEDLVEITQSARTRLSFDSAKLQTFCEENNWDNFVKKLNEIVITR